jgi:HlyD family secretion protein
MLKFFGIIILCIFLIACDHQDRKRQTIISVEKISTNKHIYYNGIIKPIHEQLIISPAGGVVSKINFHYGDFVSKNELLFTIHSPQIEDEFREVIGNYLRMKQAYLNGKKSLAGTEMLYKEKIVSEQEYLNEKNQFQVNFLNYIEASNKLKKYLVFIPSYKQELIDNSLSNFDAMSKILKESIEDLIISAPTSGIILFPEDRNSDNSKLLQIGSQIKKDEVLLDIGDLSGLSVTINATESDVNHLSLGLPVSLSFSSDLELELHGNIASIAKQAVDTTNNDFTLFPVTINILKINRGQLNKIRIGMNAKVDVLIQEPPAIKIPIESVFQKNDKFWVTIFDPKTHKRSNREVKTGETSLTDITILSGLNPGEKIIVDD